MINNNKNNLFFHTEKSTQGGLIVAFYAHNIYTYMSKWYKNYVKVKVTEQDLTALQLNKITYTMATSSQVYKIKQKVLRICGYI